MLRKIYRAITALAVMPVLAYGQPNTANLGDPNVLKRLSLEELSQIEVTTPSKEPKPAFRSPVAVYVITGEDIRRSGVTTIPDALRLAPGVHVARIDGSKWSVGIRGFGSRLARAVLVMIDGRSVYTPLFAGTYWEVQDTLLQDIDRIEVIRGPGGTIWGPNAFNGVINIITKSTKDTLGTYISAGGGNEEQGLAQFRYGGGKADGLTYRLYAKSFTRSPQYHFDGNNFDDWRGAQTGFRTDWSIGENAFTVQGDLYRQQNGQQVQIGSYSPAFQRVINQNAELSGGNVLARWTRKLSDPDSIQLQMFYDRTNRFEPNLGERRDTFDMDFHQSKTFGWRQQFSFGAGVRFSDGRFQRVASGLVFDPSSRLDYLATAFFEDSISLVKDKLALGLGAKLLRTNFAKLNAQPSVRLTWTPNAENTLWAAFSRAARTPSRVEREFYLSSFLGTNDAGVSQFARINANPAFKTEYLNGYELGYRRLLRQNLFIDTAFFWNNYQDVFSLNLLTQGTFETSLPFPDSGNTPIHGIINAQFRNDLAGFTTGGEIAPEWRPTENWRLRGTYSYLNMNLSSAASNVIGLTPDAVRGSSPRHQANIQSSIDLPHRLQLDLIYRYVGELPGIPAPSYSTGDARLSWRFSNVELSLVGRNLFQPHHIESSDNPSGPVALRRSVFASISWTK